MSREKSDVICPVEKNGGNSADFDSIEREIETLREENERYRNMFAKQTNFFIQLHKRITGEQISNAVPIEEIALRTYGYLDNILASVPGHVFWMDRNNVYLGCNRAMAESGHLSSRAEIIGKTNRELPWQDAANAIDAENEEIMLSGKKVQSEDVGEVVRGEQRYIATIVTEKSPLYSENGEVIGLIGVGIDITDRKRAQELEVQHQAAQEVIRVTNMILGSVAHELRTPLTAIGIQIDYLSAALASSKKTAAEKEAQCAATIKTVKEVVHSSAYVVNELLTKIRCFATGEVPPLDVQLASIAVDIQKVLEIYPFKDEAEKNLIKVDYANQFYYLGKPVLTRHAISNLIKNALRIVKDAGKGEVTISMRANEGFNELVLRDTGKGIAPERIAGIFDAFKSTSKSGKGTGLGLPFCKMVMQSFNGDITCNSVFGEYTEFVLSFPKYEDQIEEE